MPPGLGQTLQPRGHVDPFAVEVVAVDHHIADIDADAELEAAVGGGAIVSGA
jgi:hypothetical protein